MDKQELFERTVKAIDDYNKAVEMGLTDFENYYDSISEELYREIKKRGLEEEFEDYILTA